MAADSPTTGATYIAEALTEYGVRHVFGNPGTTELPVIDAIAARDSCQYVMALQEDIAVGMAAGYAKTRQYHSHHDPDVVPVGVVNLHAAPGVAHGLGNLHGARYTGAPIVVTAGIQGTDFQHEEPILSGDLVEMTQQFTKWSAMVNNVDALPAMLRRAVRTALTPPTGPVFLGFPLDVVEAETDASVEPLGEIPDAGSANQHQIEGAVEQLLAAREPVLVVGDHVARAGHEAVAAATRFAEAAGARVHGEILAAEASFPGDHELWHSFLPPDESTARRRMDTDLVVFAGCSTNTTITGHDRPLVDADTVCLHLSDDPRQLGKNTPADSALLGNPGTILSALAGELEERLPESDRQDRLERARSYDEGGDRADTAQGSDDERATRADLVDTIREVVPEAFIVDESVTTKYVLLDRWPLSAEQFLSSKGGGLGYGLPASVGAAIAEAQRPEPRQVIGLVGDGSYLYYPQTLYTANRYGVDLTVVIPDNRSYAVLRNNAVDMLGGDPGEYDFSAMGIDMDPTVDIAAMAASQGLATETVTSRSRIAPALRELTGEGPSLVDVQIQG